MGRIDREVVEEHLAALERCVCTLHGWREWNVTDLEGSPEKLWAVAHGVQIALQNVFDVASHLGAALTAGAAPEDYRGTVRLLGDVGVLDAGFAASIAPMAGLRNVLVHGYLRLRTEGLVDALRQLDDFSRFAREVVSFLAANPGL